MEATSAGHKATDQSRKRIKNLHQKHSNVFSALTVLPFFTIQLVNTLLNAELYKERHKDLDKPFLPFRYCGAPLFITQKAMDVPEKLLQYRFHFAAAVIASLLLSLLLYAAPRMLAILTFFWPLFASTAVFFVLIIAFSGGISQFATDAHGEKAGEGLLDYVGGRQEHDVDETHDYE